MSLSSLAALTATWLATPVAGLAIEVSAKIALACLVTLVVTGTLKAAHPEVRHTIWLVTAVGALALPSLTLILPHWLLWLPPASDAWVPQAAGAQTALLIIWAGGALVSAAVTLVGVVATQQLLKRARPLTDPAWLECLDSIRRARKVPQPVALLESADVTMPLTWDARRPVVLMPPDASSWSADRRRAVLLHEVTHIARGDFLAEVLLWLVSALYWFHPAVWYIARRVRLERELACDNTVVATGIRPSDYAEHLVEIMRSATRQRRAVVGAAAVSGPTSLHRRVTAILDPAHSAPPAPSATLPARYLPVALSAAMLVALAVPKPEPSCSDAAAPAVATHVRTAR